MHSRYDTSRRGRPMYGDISWSMFPQKKEVTPIYEDPEDTHNFFRSTLKDTSPDDPMFESDLPRRNVESRARLALRDGGARVNTDPWISEDIDLQFHDRDPRGASNLGPDFRQFKRQSLGRARLYEYAFKDDSDYSVPSSGIHPNTMRKNIKEAFHWVKSRLKIFSTGKDNWHNGGVGKHLNASQVDRQELETSTVNVDPARGPYEMRAHKTTIMSNKLHDGKYKRTLFTTDHEFKVAQYGKLYKNIRNMVHRSQVDQSVPDNPLAKMTEMRGRAPKNLVVLMSNSVKGKSALNILHKQRIKNAKDGMDEHDGFTPHSKERETMDSGRSLQLTRDIMALLGFVKQDIDMAESKEGENPRKIQKMMNARKIMDLTEMVHALPANLKLNMRTELIRTAGGGLMPGSASQIRKQRDKIVINRKLIKYAANEVRTQMTRGKTLLHKNRLLADGSVDVSELTKIPLFTLKTMEISRTDTRKNKNKSKVIREKSGKLNEDKEVHSYSKQLPSLIDKEKNRAATKATQVFKDTKKMLIKKSKDLNKKTISDTKSTETDNKFGENRYLDRRLGAMGKKYQRRDVVTDIVTFDKLNDLEQVSRTHKF